MKNVFLAILALLPVFAMAQQTEGVVQYEEVLKMKIELSPEMKQYAHLLPTEERVMMDLTFNEDESLYEKADVVKEAEEDPFAGGNMQVEAIMIGGPGSAIVYHSSKDKSTLKAEDSFGKKFLVSSDWEEREWKMLAEQKEILGFTCMKAESVTDSTSLTVWFSPEIPVSFGPADFIGLPGLILAMDYTQDGADISINATKVGLKSVDDIEKPSKGKKVTEDEYREIITARMNEMNMMQGGNKVSSDGNNVEIRISTGGN